jgi:hypothetical protein
VVRDEFGDGVVEDVALRLLSSGELSRLRQKVRNSADLLVEHQVVSVAIVFFERELGSVVLLNLFNRRLESLESVCHRLDMLFGADLSACSAGYPVSRSLPS